MRETDEKEQNEQSSTKPNEQHRPSESDELYIPFNEVVEAQLSTAKPEKLPGLLDVHSLFAEQQRKLRKRVWAKRRRV
jgi:hypothetical protein